MLTILVTTLGIYCMLSHVPVVDDSASEARRRGDRCLFVMMCRTRAELLVDHRILTQVHSRSAGNDIVPLVVDSLPA